MGHPFIHCGWPVASKRGEEGPAGGACTHLVPGGPGKASAVEVQFPDSHNVIVGACGLCL